MSNGKDPPISQSYGSGQTWNTKTRHNETCTSDELVFDKSIIESSFATRFGFVCGNFPLRGIFNSFAMGGMLLGSFAIGAVSDRFGRRPACILRYAYF